MIPSFSQCLQLPKVFVSGGRCNTSPPLPTLPPPPPSNQKMGLKAQEGGLQVKGSPCNSSISAIFSQFWSSFLLTSNNANGAILWLCIEKNNMGWFLTETETLSQTDRRRGEAKFNFMQVFLKTKISWNKSAPRTQPRDRGVQDFYIITTSFMAIHEIVLCELAGSQNWSNRLFYQHDFVRDCSDHLEKRQREMWRDDWMNLTWLLKIDWQSDNDNRHIHRTCMLSHCNAMHWRRYNS